MEALTYVLTVLAGVVVVSTALRVGEGSGRVRTSTSWIRLHTVAGALGFVIWLVFLIAPEDSPVGSSLAGIIGLFFWWLAAIAGLMLLTRWMPARGRHAGGDRRGRWAAGPVLGLIAHLGVLVAVVVFTWAYLIQAV